MNTLIIWIIMLVFLILVLVIIAASRDQSTSVLGGLCEKSGGLFGC